MLPQDNIPEIFLPQFSEDRSCQQFAKEQLKRLELQYIQKIFPAAVAITTAKNEVKSHEDCKEFAPLLVALSLAMPHEILKQMSCQAIPSLQQFSSLNVYLAAIAGIISGLVELVNSDLPCDEEQSLIDLKEFKSTLENDTETSPFNVIQNYLERIKCGTSATVLVCQQIEILFRIKLELDVRLSTRLGTEPELAKFVSAPEVTFEQLQKKLAEIQNRIKIIPVICKAMSEQLESYKAQVLERIKQIIERASSEPNESVPSSTFRP